MRRESDQNLQWKVLWIKPKPLLSLKTNCIALMNIQILVHFENLTRAAETEQLRKFFHLTATRVKKLAGKPLLYMVYSSVISDKCLCVPSLKISSALAPVNWNLKCEILHKLRKSFCSEFFIGCCRTWNRFDGYSVNTDLPLTFRNKTNWSTKIWGEEMSIKHGRKGWWLKGVSPTLSFLILTDKNNSCDFWDKLEPPWHCPHLCQCLTGIL